VRGGEGEPPDANKEVAVETPAEETLPWRGRRRRSGGGGGGAPPLDLAESSTGREKRLRGTGTSPRSVQAGRDSAGILGSLGPQTPVQRVSKYACWTPRGKFPGGLPARGNDGDPRREVGFQTSPYMLVVFLC